MEKYEIVILIVLIIALLFFGFTLLGGSEGNVSGAAVSSYPAQYSGGGCGR